MAEERPTWIVMPVVAGLEATTAAIADCLAQSVPTRLLVVNQGADDRLRDHLERLSEEYAERLLLWSHQPPLPSLAATWNRALQFVWETGGTEALVVNNDVRLRRDTVWALQTVLQRTKALFVSAVGVAPGEFDLAGEAVIMTYFDQATEHETTAGMKGGPDFSCFLISRACHDRFQFDERFIPAFCEDLDYHRRLMLAGEGGRIFSVNVPYAHQASGTLKTLEVEQPAEAGRIRRQIEALSRRYYAEKWGGGVNEETYLVPFGGGWTRPAARQDGSATTPYLQAHPDEQRVEGLGVDRRVLDGQGNLQPVPIEHDVRARPTPIEHDAAMTLLSECLTTMTDEQFRALDARHQADVERRTAALTPTQAALVDRFDKQQDRVHAEALCDAFRVSALPGYDDHVYCQRPAGHDGPHAYFTGFTPAKETTDGQAPGRSEPDRPTLPGPVEPERT